MRKLFFASIFMCIAALCSAQEVNKKKEANQKPSVIIVDEKVKVAKPPAIVDEKVKVAKPITKVDEKIKVAKPPVIVDEKVKVAKPAKKN